MIFNFALKLTNPISSFNYLKLKERQFMTKNALVIFSVMILSFISSAQDFRTPRPSPDATVSQFVGVTKITIDYSSPAVKNRKIWGELVPFGQIWRTGANEATTITFTDVVSVNGNELAAGTYAIHCIPNVNEWEIIFSKDVPVDGSSTLDPKKEAITYKSKTRRTSFSGENGFLIY